MCTFTGTTSSRESNFTISTKLEVRNYLRNLSMNNRIAACTLHASVGFLGTHFCIWVPHQDTLILLLNCYQRRDYFIEEELGLNRLPA